MWSFSSIARGQGSSRGGGSTVRPGRRTGTCALSWCTKASTPGHNFCGKEHAWECVKRGELPACVHCKTYPKNPPHEYCGEDCGRAANTAALLSRQTVPAAPIPLFQPPTTSGATATNLRRMRPTSGVSNATLRPRPASMRSTTYRNVQQPSPPPVETPSNPPSPPMLSPPTTCPERAYFYDPCGCKITTTMDMPPTYYICPVCKKRATPSHVEVDGKIQKFAHPGIPSAAKTIPSVSRPGTDQTLISDKDSPTALETPSPPTVNQTSQSLPLDCSPAQNQPLLRLPDLAADLSGISPNGHIEGAQTDQEVGQSKQEGDPTLESSDSDWPSPELLDMVGPVPELWDLDEPVSELVDLEKDLAVSLSLQVSLTTQPPGPTIEDDEDKFLDANPMDEILFLQLSQKGNLRNSLLATRDAEIIALSTSNMYWGCDMSKGEGQNELGKALVRVRAQLREAQ